MWLAAFFQSARRRPKKEWSGSGFVVMMTYYDSDATLDSANRWLDNFLITGQKMREISRAIGNDGDSALRSALGNIQDEAILVKITQPLAYIPINVITSRDFWKDPEKTEIENLKLKLPVAIYVLPEQNPGGWKSMRYANTYLLRVQPMMPEIMKTC